MRRRFRPRLHPFIECVEPRRLLAGDFAFAFALGSSQNDRAADVAVDAAGNIVMAGHFKGTVDFDPSGATQSRMSAGDYDLYVAKYSSSGSLLWVKTMGGPGWDESMALALDASGSIFLTGYFYGSADFDPGAGVANLTSQGEADGYVLKLTSGGSFAWVKQFAGAASSGGTSIATDADGAVYIGGMYSGQVDVNPSNVVNIGTSNGSLDAFVVKLTASGSYVFGKKFGGSGEDYVNGVAIGGDGHVQIVGSFRNSVDFDPSTNGEKKLKSAGGSDVFISELSSNGSFVSAKRIGGSGDDVAGDVAADKSGNVVITGGFRGTVDFNPNSGTANRTSAGNLDAFVLKLNSAASYVWAYAAGGSSLDRGTDIALLSDGGVVFTGQFAGSAKFGGDAGTLSSSGGTSDAMTVNLTSAGRATWARKAGGSGANDVGEGIGIHAASRSVVVVGNFSGSGDFDGTAGTRTLTSAGEVDAFLLKLLA